MIEEVEELPLDHIGVAIPMEEGIQVWMQVIGSTPFHVEEVLEQGVKVFFYRVGKAVLEILVPLSTDSPVGRFLEKRGPGVHHLAFYTEDLLRERDRLKALGLRPLSEEPQIAARGKKAIFFHPKDTHGVLIEIVSRAY